MSEPLIKYTGVTLCQGKVPVLKSLHLTINKGEFVYLTGKVGSGKSTLLKSLYAEVPIAKGDARIFNYYLSTIRNKDVPALRRRLGIIFQDFQLLNDRSVYKNLEFVLRATGWKATSEIAQKINLVLTQVGMTNKSEKMPYELSGGEQQRIAIARALLNSPEIILADEPTGNIDTENGNEIVQLLHTICDRGATVLMATHNPAWIQNYPGRVLHCEHEHVSEI